MKDNLRRSAAVFTREAGPPDLSARFHCSIFDAGACELWMVLMENNTAFDKSTGVLLQKAQSGCFLGGGFPFSFYRNHQLQTAGTRAPKGPASRHTEVRSSPRAPRGNLSEKPALPSLVSVLQIDVTAVPFSTV